ncbi:hypothetical protein C7S15_8522 [Burkholderia cepacia]|nr:hypothetical protein [Burkholderia cepacia]
MPLAALQFVPGNKRFPAPAGEVVWTSAPARVSVSIIFSAARIIFKARRAGDSRRSGDGPRFWRAGRRANGARPARRPPWSET